MKPTLLLLILCSLALAAQAQSTISTTNRYAYSANSGWLDLRPSTGDGVRVSDTFLAGYAYLGNIGWINLGGGTPINGYAYSNGSATDFGVNLSASGLLTGNAYAANVGWITFEQTHGNPRLNLVTGEFTGFAYSANLGWVALNTFASSLATTTLSRPDTDGDGIPDGWERLYFGNLTTVNAATDSDGDGVGDLAEYRAGTVPNDRASAFRITNQSLNAAFTTANITFTIVPTRQYQIETTTDLKGLWADSGLGIFTPPAGATATSVVSSSAAAGRFYRAKAVQPLP